MIAYPMTLEEDDGAVLATSPDFPELTTVGDDREEAITRAVQVLEEALAARIHDRRDIPPPARGAPLRFKPSTSPVRAWVKSLGTSGITREGSRPSRHIHGDPITGVVGQSV